MNISNELLEAMVDSLAEVESAPEDKRAVALIKARGLFQAAFEDLSDEDANTPELAPVDIMRTHVAQSEYSVLSQPWDIPDIPTYMTAEHADALLAKGRGLIADRSARRRAAVNLIGAGIVALGSVAAGGAGAPAASALIPGISDAFRGLIGGE